MAQNCLLVEDVSKFTNSRLTTSALYLETKYLERQRWTELLVKTLLNVFDFHKTLNQVTKLKTTPEPLSLEGYGITKPAHKPSPTIRSDDVKN